MTMSVKDLPSFHIPPELDIPGITSDMPEFTIKNIITFVAAMAMVFGGVVPFIPQYRDIKKSENAEGFSTFVCLTLLIANILRIMFWFGKHFELPLLAQSYIMVVTMLIMVQLCVKVKRKTELVQSKSHKFTDDNNEVLIMGTSVHAIRRDHSVFEIPQDKTADVDADNNINSLVTVRVRHVFSDFDPQHFWRWTDFGSYLQFTACFTAVIGFVTYLLSSNVIYVETVGFLAVFCEALLGAPQFYRNFVNKSTQGMSKKMVGFWTCGDVFKTVYFILREAPAQFWICGMLQVSIDISIFIQVFMYRNLPSKTHKNYR